MRFSRDKRGYENTSVVHADKRRGRRSRILYWFRTPPGVRVGRAAIDEEAIRLIEEHNPDIHFDWTRILKSPAGETPIERREQRRRQGPKPPVQPAAPVAAPANSAATGSTESKEPPGSEPVDVARPVSAAEAKLGAEALGRLRGRYAEMLARITDRLPDPERQAELKILAERLNPDAWVTDSDVLVGLDAYEATYESLRSVVGHRRRRGRRRRGRGPAAGNGSDGD